MPIYVLEYHIKIYKIQKEWKILSLLVKSVRLWPTDC